MDLDLLQLDPCWLFTGSDAFSVISATYTVFCPGRPPAVCVFSVEGLFTKVVEN